MVVGNKGVRDSFLKEKLLLERLVRKLKMDSNNVKNEIVGIFWNLSILGEGSEILKLYIELDIIGGCENYLLLEEEEDKIKAILICLTLIVDNLGDKNRIKGENIMKKRIRRSTIPKRIL